MNRLFLSLSIPNVSAFAAKLIPVRMLKMTMPGLLIGADSLVEDHEAYLVPIFCRVAPGSVVVDVGSFYGYYAMLASRYVGDGQVIGVEPYPDSFRVLKKNTAGLANVKVVDMALSDRNGLAKLYIDRFHPSAHSITLSGSKRSLGYIMVRSRTLDSLLEDLRIEKIDLLKVDVEGAEAMVLRGAERTLRRSQNVTVVVEAHGIMELSVKSFLKRLGFYVMWLGPRHLIGVKSKYELKDINLRLRGGGSIRLSPIPADKGEIEERNSTSVTLQPCSRGSPGQLGEAI